MTASQITLDLWGKTLPSVCYTGFRSVLETLEKPFPAAHWKLKNVTKKNFKFLPELLALFPGYWNWAPLCSTTGSMRKLKRQAFNVVTIETMSPIYLRRSVKLRLSKIADASRLWRPIIAKKRIVIMLTSFHLMQSNCTPSPWEKSSLTWDLSSADKNKSDKAVASTSPF